MGPVTTTNTAAWIVACLLAGFAVVFSYGFEPLYDTPNTGDETMSMVQAYNVYTTGIPGYGYRADGSPKMLPSALLTPGSEYWYGSLVSRFAPLDRLPGVRLVSRCLMGAALGLCLTAVVLCGRRSGWDVITALLLGCALCALFALRYSFVYAGSSARYDASGTFLVALFWLLAALRLRGGQAAWLLAAGFVAFASLGLNHFPFVFCVTAYVVLAAWHFLDADRGKRGWFVVGNVVMLALAVGAQSLFGMGLVETGQEVAGGANHQSQLLELAGRLAEVRPGNLLGYVKTLGYPKVFGLMLFSILAGVALLPSMAGRGRWRMPLALCVVLPVALALALRSLPHSRFSYEPMMLLSVFMPVACVVRIGARGLVGVGFAALLAGLVITHATPSNWGFRAQQGGVAAVVEGFRGYASIPSWNQPQARANARRDALAGQLLAYLAGQGAQTVVVNDPLFNLLDHGQLRFVHLRQQLDPAGEAQALESFASPQGSGWFVLNAGGNSGFLTLLGFPQVEAALLKNREQSVELDVAGRRIAFEFVRTFGDEHAVDQYAYVDEPSTPFGLYRYVILARDAAPSTPGEQ